MPARAGPASAGEGGAALDDAVRLRDRRLVLADELRQDHPLRCEVRRHEAAEQEDEREQEREVEQAGRVQDAAARRAAARARRRRRASSCAHPAARRRIPLGIPKIAIGRISTARTIDIFAADPVVTSTNHGSAR